MYGWGQSRGYRKVYVVVVAVVVVVVVVVVVAVVEFVVVVVAVVVTNSCHNPEGVHGHAANVLNP